MKHVEVLFDLIELIQLFISVQLEALAFLISYIIITIVRFVKAFFTKKETTYEKVINYIKNNKIKIIHNILLFIFPVSSNAWCVAQFYTFISSFYNEDWEILISFFSVFANMICTGIANQIFLVFE
ncbi:diadenosine tetraphosphatase and related serine/threonine protein phosphatases (apicoplast) [Babesia ovis]|uniref:Diadenosine tetraphosphatase and related serine/threonine protein phosphatases n=1 Tax=Babesia ovis TaxID=5869 RepID=A0A9W5TDM9_BABOV|nr:hypothetical protein BaOVIS_034970 [Babesia ovis]GFE55945.1 diadenosine tetraphosphatase and related serine/threonine protein phosphatases [Babesia ovis]